MAGLAPHADRFFKFLFVLVLFALAMTLFVGNHTSIRSQQLMQSLEFPVGGYIPQRRRSNPALFPLEFIHDDIRRFLWVMNRAHVRLLLAPTYSFVATVVHLNSIPPVLRWLQYFSLLKYCLEALSVNEINSGLMISDTLQGVPVNVSAVVIMELVSFLAPHSRWL